MLSTITQFCREAGASLQYKNMRLYCAGALISLFGSMMQESMVAWVAFRLSGSTAVLGTVMACFMLPMVVASIPGGWVADRFDRKGVVIITQAIALCIAVCYAVMAAQGTLTLTAIYGLTAALGVTVAFEMSSRMAMLPSLVDNPEHIGNAFALDSLMFYACRLCGPAIGAVLLMVASPALGFAVNAASYILELSLLSRIKPPQSKREANKAGLKDAFAFAFGDQRRRRVMVLLAVTTFFGVYIQMMPAFTAMRNGTAMTNGMLIFASEIGAVVASLLIARKLADAGKLPFLRRAIGWAGVIFALSLAAFVLTKAAWLSLLLMVPVGFSMSTIFAGSQAVLQSEVDDRMRGAFTAMFYNFAYFGMLAIGGPVLGFASVYIGLTATTCVAASCCFAASVHYLAKQK